MRPDYTPRQIERFWSYVDRSGGPDACWPWIRSRTPRGYGQYGVHRNGKLFNQRTHRIAYYLTHGSWPEPLACHTCHNRFCCNPAHIYEGTPKQNTSDMMALGRHNRPHARFTDEEVREFRRRHAAGESLKSIAGSVNHDMSAMSKLLRGLHYRHVSTH